MQQLCLLFVALSGLTFFSCDEQQSSDSIQRKQQEQLSLQATQTVGMPSVTNFQEKKMLKNIIELRDSEIKTITYLVDFNGRLHKICDSVGYGFSAAMQYTNPQRMVWNQHGTTVLPQADPNGLFSPASADGTWVNCYNPKDKKLSPVYMEPRVIVSPFELDVK